MFRVRFAFNDSYILENQVGYSKIFLIRVTYMSVKWTASMRVLRLNSLKHFMNLQDMFRAEMNTTIRTKYVRKGAM